MLNIYCAERYMENVHRHNSEHRRPEIRLFLCRLYLLDACHNIISTSDMRRNSTAIFIEKGDDSAAIILGCQLSFCLKAEMILKERTHALEFNSGSSIVKIFANMKMYNGQSRYYSINIQEEWRNILEK